MVCCRPPTHKEIELIPNFLWSVVKLPIWLSTLLLAITCVSDIQMGHASPLWTSPFQELSNDIRNSSIQWVLTYAIAFWKFESPLGTPTPKMGAHLGVWVFIFTLSQSPRLHFWPAPLQALALIATMGNSKILKIFKLWNPQLCKFVIPTCEF
jgi:hypothetical protein